MNTYLKFVIILFFIIIASVCHAETFIKVAKNSDIHQLLSQIEGEWQIFKLPPSNPVVEKILHNNPSAEMGKTITFNHGKVFFRIPFLFFDTCAKNMTYKFLRKKIESNEITDQASLNFYFRSNEAGGYGPLRDDVVTEVILYCDKRPIGGFDVSKGGFLATYWDEGFYYLEKVSPNKNKQ